MGSICLPHKVNLIVGLISQDTDLIDRIKKKLEHRFNNTVDFESNLLSFTHTDYYKEEFGPRLKRKFLSFKRLAPLSNIYNAKLKTNEMERSLSRGTRRRINIDPGYLDLSKLVLFSTKDYTHRIYLNKGIYSEVTLFYRNKTFTSWPWTYPDYQSEPYIKIFNAIRELYKKKISVN